MRKAGWAILCMAAFLLLVSCASADIVINEVMASNGFYENGEAYDWIEIHNDGKNTVDLSGWYLSDNPEKLTKWALPGVSMAPGEYLLIFLSGKDQREGELHASFSLSAGETLVLYDSAALRFDSLPIPETAQNVSIGRNAAGETVFYSHPTPLEENGNPMPTGK